MLPRSFAAVLLLLAPSLAGASTLCVNTAGSGGCFATIQQAVNAASSGTLIEVAAGTYTENVVVGPPKRLTIQGAGPGATTVDGSGSGPAIHVAGTNTFLILMGLSVQDGVPGIAVDAQAKLMVSACAVTGSTPGIKGLSKSSVTVRDCDVSGNFDAPPITTTGGILVDGVGKLTVADSTISGNSGRGIDSYSLKLSNSTVSANTGGGIGLLKGSITGSTISGNDAGAFGGGGIGTSTTSSVIKIENSTISGNSASVGGGIAGQQPLLLEHVTIAGNSATVRGGGLDFDVRGSTFKATLKATIIADNTAPTGADCYSGAVRSSGTNLVEDTSSCTITPLGSATLISADPLLGPLQNNGGATETRALLPGSPAIAVVTAGALCRKPDQRGVARSVPCDLGAYEAP